MNIFSMAYWKEAAKDCSNLRRLSLAALFCALAVVLEKLEIPLAPSLQVQFTFLPLALCGAICGPILAMVAAGAADTLYALLLSPFPYFPGYLLSKLLVGLVFGLFLYRRKITVGRLLGAKLLMNFFINVGLGSLWNYMMFDKGYLAFLVPSAIKNALLFPLEVLLMAAMFGAVMKPAVRMGLLPAHTVEELQRLDFRRAARPVLCGVGGFLGFLCIAMGYYSSLWWLMLLGAALVLTALIFFLIKNKKQED